jgi:class 3 adenylate cyclase/pimeloyl-ACP methyl ester carboxylesterase
MATGHSLIRYDARATGLSDRDVTDFSLEAQQSDLDAVVKSSGADKFVLLAMSDMAIVAIAWISANPGRVSHLLLWNGWASRALVTTGPTKALRTLMEQDWNTYTETAARVILGWSGSPQEAATLAEFYRACTTQDAILKQAPIVYEWDVTPILGQIDCPVLVMQRTGVQNVSSDVARDLTKRIPNAHLALFDGRSPVPFSEDTGAVIGAITEFLGGDPAATKVTDVAAGASVTLLVTDMEGSTALTQRLGDDAAQDVVRVHNRIVRDALIAHGGTEVKHTGDGLMITFHSATQGVECAIQIQQRVAEYSESHPETPLRVRCGLNAGEPVAESGDYFGTAVQLAARICQVCEPGTITVTSVVRDLTAGKRFLFADLGEHVPRGFEDPVRLYQVHW